MRAKDSGRGARPDGTDKLASNVNAVAACSLAAVLFFHLGVNKVEHAVDYRIRDFPLE
jgi:hypothetical protein